MSVKTGKPIPLGPVCAMSLLLTDLLSTGLLAFAGAVVIAGGPLLWAFVRYKPITRRAYLHAVLNFVAIGSWLTIGNAATKAYERGLISLFTCIVIVFLLLVVVAGGGALVAWRYPTGED
jgi:hypothetical protein